MPSIKWVGLAAMALLGTSLGMHGGTDSAGVEVTRSSGGTIGTDPGHCIVLDEESTLQQERIAVKHDVPARLKGTPGARTIYESERYSGDYLLETQSELELAKPISAVEIRDHVSSMQGCS